MKISFMLSGGGIPPFSYYKPVVVPSTVGADDESTTAKTASTSSKASNSDIGIKDILTMLSKIDGLPADVLKLSAGLLNFLTLQSYMGTELNTSALASMYVQYLSLVKQATFSKKEYDKAYQEVNKNNGLDEVAITNQGKLVVLTKDGISTVTVDEFNKNRNKYNPLTNSNLLYLRAYNTNSPFSDDVYGIVENGIGLTQVANLVSKLATNLGTSEIKQEGYYLNDDAQKGIEFLKNAAAQGADVSGLGIKGLYKVGALSRTQAQQAQAALTYIYNMLPDNAKTLLKYKTGSEDAAKQLVGSLLVSKESATSQFTADLILDADGKKPGSKDSKSGSGDDGDSKYKVNTVEQFVSGHGYDQGFTILNGTSNGIQITHSNNMPVVTKDGNPLGECTVKEIKGSQFGPILDTLNVSMGGAMISETNLNRIRTDGEAYSMDLPVDTDALAQGIIKPDFAMLQKMEQANDLIRQQGITDYEQINKIYEQCGISAKYKADGTLSTTWRRFAAFNGTAVSSAFSEDPTFATQLKEVTDGNSESALTEFFTSKDKNFQFDKKSMWDSFSPVFNGHDSYYEGTVFIPIKANVFNASAGNGTLLTPDLMKTLDEKQQQADRLNNYINPNDL